jgi:glycine/D-amino acid oxidase-like deaminating enzyme/nitrite reductase/ring-hydroxylating ferredoxin subunit
MAGVDVPQFSAVTAPVDVDVCVVGGGISGLTSAYLLAQAGKSVAVVEQGEIAAGDTSRTTAHLASVIDDGLARMERWHGKENAKLAVESHAAAIDQIERIVSQEQINCDFTRVDAYLFGGSADKSSKSIDEEEAAARRLEKGGVGHSRAPREGFETGPTLRFARQGQFHVMKYMRGLASAIRAKGGKIFQNTHVLEVKVDPTPVVTTKDGQTIKAAAVVIATNSPILGGQLLKTKLPAYRTYAIAAAVPRDSVPQALFWDTEDPYHYVRTQPSTDEAGHPIDLLIVGGEDHKTGQEQDMDARYARLEAWARERWPMLGAIQYRWSGQVLETPDGLAYIGPDPKGQKGVYVAGGDSGHGMTHGTLAGMILRDLIMGQTNPYAALYNPSRPPVRSIGEWVKENLNVAAQYAQWAGGGEVASADQIPAGHGAIVRHGLKMVATYKADDGAVSECSAVCTHMECIVHWNPGEKSWDCPCHGSRFSPTGQVIAGPATKDLSAVEKSSKEERHATR